MLNLKKLDMVKINKNIVIIVLAALLMAVGYFGYSYWKKYRMEVESTTSLVNGLSDSLTTERNKNGSQTARINSIVAQNEDLLLSINTKDESIIQLQNLVREKNNRNNQLEDALALKTNLLLQYMDSLDNMVIGSVIINDTIYYTYEKNFKLYNEYDDKDTIVWVFGNVILGKMLFEVSLDIKNRYDVTIGRERKNVFKRWESYADITTYNPYDNVSHFRSYSKQKIKPKRFGIGFSVGYAFILNGALSPYIGVGVNYNLIEF